MKFFELRKVLSAFSRLSICDKDTLNYNNFISIHDVPEEYDDLSVSGVGMIDSEFYKMNEYEYAAQGNSQNIALLPCIEIIVSPGDDR